MSIIDQFREYLIKEKNFSLHTLRAYVKDVESFVFFLGSKHFTEVTSRDARQWVSQLSKTKISNRTINRKIASLKTFYKYLYVTQTVSIFPFELIPNLKVQKKVIIPVSEDEIASVDVSDQKLNAYENSRNKLIFYFFYALGIRKSELINLKNIEVGCDVVKVSGKGNKQRYLPLSKDLKKEVDCYLALKKEFLIVGDYFFMLKKTEKLNQTFVYRLINNYISSVTTKTKTSPHILRHSFATHLLKNGADINSVKELLGHSSLRSTQVYVHNSIDELKKVYNRTHPKNIK